MVVEFPSILQSSVLDLLAYIVIPIVFLLLLYKLYKFRMGAVFIFNYIVMVYRSSLKLGLSKTLGILISVALKDFAGQMSSFETVRRHFTHLCIFWGFAGLMVTTTIDNFVNHPGLPLPLFSLVRVLGNVSGVVLMIGLTVALGRRLVYKEVRERTSGYDLLFFSLLYLTAISGFATEFTSMAGIYTPTFFSYWTHIILVALLFLTAPLTKFVHSIKLPLLILFYRLREALMAKGEFVPFQPIGVLEQELLRR